MHAYIPFTDVEQLGKFTIVPVSAQQCSIIIRGLTRSSVNSLLKFVDSVITPSLPEVINVT